MGATEEVRGKKSISHQGGKETPDGRRLGHDLLFGMEADIEKDPKTNWRILVIDDDEDDFVLTKHMIERATRAEYQIDWERLYDRGLQTLAEGKVDIALVDYQLGAQTGLDLIREARGRGISTPLILLTGKGGYDVDVEAMEAGATDYMAKEEATPSSLERAIRYALERQQSEDARSRLIAILEATPDLISITDSGGHVLYLNRSARRFVDLSEGGPSQPLHREEIAPWNSEIVRKSGIPAAIREGRWQGETSLTRPSGETAPFSQVVISHQGSDGEVAYLSTVAHDISRLKRAEEELRKSAERSQVLARLSQQFAGAGLEYCEVLDTVAREITSTFGDACIIHTASDDHTHLDVGSFHFTDGTIHAEMNSNLEKARIPIGEGISGRVYQTGDPVFLADLTPEQRMAMLDKEFWFWANRFSVVSAVVLPLPGYKSRVGTLTVLRFEPGVRFNREDRAFLLDLAARAGLAVENARLYQAQADRARELNALHSATLALLGTLDLEELLAQIMDAVLSAMPSAEEGALYLLASDTGRLQAEAVQGNSDMRIRRLTRSRLRGIAAKAVRERRPLLINRIPNRGQGEGYSEIASPLFAGRDVIGVICLTALQSGTFQPVDLRLLSSFAATAATAIQKARLHAEVQELAVTDPLTSSYNRRGFFEVAQKELERAIHFRLPISLIMLDLDLFKDVNDRCGHIGGDFVLNTLAERMRNTVRGADVVGRYGGDEFIILLPETELTEAVRIAERIRERVEEPLRLPEAVCDGENIRLSVSLGVTKILDGEADLTNAIRRADSAAYQAKNQGRNRVVIAGS